MHIEQLAQLGSAVKSVNSNLSLDEVKYLKYLSGIETRIELSKIFYNSWGVYQPLKVAVTDIPHYIEHKNHPLKQYDELDNNATPFWLRKYQVKNPASKIRFFLLTVTSLTEVQ